MMTTMYEGVNELQLPFPFFSIVCQLANFGSIRNAFHFCRFFRLSRRLTDSVTPPGDVGYPFLFPSEMQLLFNHLVIYSPFFPPHNFRIRASRVNE
jgi:hypothetical protein